VAVVDKYSVPICRPLLMPMKVDRREPVKDLRWKQDISAADIKHSSLTYSANTQEQDKFNHLEELK